VTLFNGAPRRRRGQRGLSEVEWLCLRMHPWPDCDCAFRKAEARAAFEANRGEFEDRPPSSETCAPWQLRFGLATPAQREWHRRMMTDPRK
jgi:hypothetical protein